MGRVVLSLFHSLHQAYSTLFVLDFDVLSFCAHLLFWSVNPLLELCLVLELRCGMTVLSTDQWWSMQRHGAFPRLCCGGESLRPSASAAVE